MCIVFEVHQHNFVPLCPPEPKSKDTVTKGGAHEVRSNPSIDSRLNYSGIPVATSVGGGHKRPALSYSTGIMYYIGHVWRFLLTTLAPC